MGRKHDKDEILAAGLALAIEEGLSGLTFGRLAKRLDIPDRTVVYYFPTKNDLVVAVLAALGEQLQTTLGAAFSSPASDHRALVRRAWPVLARPDVDPLFAIFFEANGLAAAGRSPYAEVVPALVTGWIEWTSRFVEGPARDRKVEAESAVAMIDGLLLMRQLAGPAAANRAAKRLGVA